MRYASLALAAIIAVPVVGFVHFALSSIPPLESYNLVGTAYGEDHVLDENLSMLDCLEAAAYQRTRWGTNVTFDCERIR